jgi:hypothetical protein
LKSARIEGGAAELTGEGRMPRVAQSSSLFTSEVTGESQQRIYTELFLNESLVGALNGATAKRTGVSQIQSPECESESGPSIRAESGHESPMQAGDASFPLRSTQPIIIGSKS